MFPSPKHREDARELIKPYVGKALEFDYSQRVVHEHSAEIVIAKLLSERDELLLKIAAATPSQA